MVKCSVCGKKGFLLKTDRCILCGNEVCKDCWNNFFVMEYSDSPTYGLTFKRPMRFCSTRCHDTFISQVKASNYRKEIGLDEHKAENYSFDYYCMKILDPTLPNIDRQIRKSLRLYPEATLYRRFSSGTDEFLSLREEFHRECRLALAKNLEQAGRYEKAALVYEKLDDYDSARKMREKDKMVEVRHSHVSVDLNTLLKQFREGGIVAVYRCPNCNGKLKISKETTLKSLRFCEYCGSEIEALDLADFLKTAMS